MYFLKKSNIVFEEGISKMYALREQYIKRFMKYTFAILKIYFLENQFWKCIFVWAFLTIILFREQFLKIF